MRLKQSVSMLDGTKVLLGSRRDFRDHGKQAVDVRAIDAADLLDGVQIGKPAAIEYQVVLSANFWDTVDWEADKLIELNASVDHQKGDYAGINQRR